MNEEILEQKDNENEKNEENNANDDNNDITETTEENKSAEEEAPEETEKKAGDDTARITAAEKQEIISDFAPEPISIPNYNLQKEKEKHIKKGEKKKKRSSKKNKKRRRIIRKILRAVRTVVLFVLITGILTGLLSSLLIKVSTSEYSIENAVRSNRPEEFTVGRIKDVSALNIKKSSPHASVADILRDNAMSTTTYEDIAQAVQKSSFSGYVARQAHGVISNLLYGTEYAGLKESEISKAFRENISYIKLATGVEIGESACNDFGKYIASSSAFDDIKPDNLSKTPLAKHTQTTKVLLSLFALACLAGALVIVIVITAATCSGYAHRVIGWGMVLSGVITAVAGCLYTPWFKTGEAFVQCIINAILKGLHMNALIYGGAAVIIGVLVLLIGKAMNYDDEEEYEE